jgi:RecB family exonuclease
VGIAGGRAFVRDFKSYTATRAAQSLQLALLGLATARLTRLDEADVGMMVLRGDGKWFIDRHVIDAYALVEIRERLRSIRARVIAAGVAMEAGEMPAAHAGDHCTYCPAQRACPAQAALVRTAAGWELATVKERIAALSDEEAGEAWVMIDRVADIAEAARKALRARARLAPIPIPGGKVLREMAWSAWQKSEIAKAEIAKLESDLEARGEIRKVSTTQARVGSARRA